MSDDQVHVGMSLPLDSDGFMRRECPTCEREFKWLHGSPANEDATPVPIGGYFCPYCGIQAPADAWLTQEQVALAHNTVATEVVGPMVERFGRLFRYEPPEKMDPLSEMDDMKRVDFTCHPTEPVKILDHWRDAVYCLCCGTTTPSQS